MEDKNKSNQSNQQSRLNQSGRFGQQNQNRGRFGGNRFGGGPRGRFSGQTEREEKEYDEKMLDLRRVSRVTAGGKRFSFRATMAIGNKKGKVGIGVAKGKDVAQAIAKAKAAAEKNILLLPFSNGTIPHEVSAKYCAAKIILKPASKGHGLVAGGSVRIICNLAGIKDLSAKILGTTTNKLSNARATLVALKKFKTKK